MENNIRNNFINLGKYVHIGTINLSVKFKILIFKTTNLCKFYSSYDREYKLEYKVPKDWLSYSIVPINKDINEVHCEFFYRFRNQAELFNHIDFIIDSFKNSKIEIINIKNGKNN